MSESQDKKGLLSREDSLIISGVGILLMLIHHLFYSESSRELYDDIEPLGYGMVNEIGKFCKLCVSIFVFKSGYGLTINWDKNKPQLKEFYTYRLKKLYLNYWFIWLLFVPVGVFLFDRTFTDVYGDYYVIKFILDFAGVLNCFGMLGYNPTWWFYSCINCYTPFSLCCKR